MEAFSPEGRDLARKSFRLLKLVVGIGLIAGLLLLASAYILVGILKPLGFGGFVVLPFLAAGLLIIDVIVMRQVLIKLFKFDPRRATIGVALIGVVVFLLLNARAYLAFP